MHRFILGLAKLPEKQKITQTEKCQRDCVYDRSKRNRGYIKACLAYDDEKNTIAIRGNNAFATDESRTSKVSGGLVNFLVY